jgi:glyoxylase-like metal-dependent hydrolase (beta-lactamase superfamily II)
VLFRQFVDDDLGCASYLIGDTEAGVAAVVDPAYAIEPYLEEAERAGVRIERVLETHTHADHVSGHGRFALEHGVVVSIHPAAGPDYPFEPLEDGAEVALGSVRLRAIHTPGHRPEHTSFAIVESGDTRHVLTGDCLFVGAVARPDLAVEAREGAEHLFHSLHRLLELPDAADVYPGHVAGSLCGAAMSPERSSTIGAERSGNEVLALENEDEFVAATTGQPMLRPPNIERIVALNRGPFLGAPAPLERLGDAHGVTILDVRAAAAFARGHVAGAINVPLGVSRFATKAGFVLSADEPVAIHADSAGDAARAARGLRAIGFLELAGYLDAPPTPARLDPIALDELELLLAAGDVKVLDVREIEERDGGYIAGTMHVPYRLLRGRGAGFAEDGQPVVTICESGERAGIAASVLAAAGVEARPVLGGGIPEWQERGGRTIEFRRCGSG